MATKNPKTDKSESVGGGGMNKVDNSSSYSEKLRTNVRYDQRLKRNVLEIALEKTDSDADIDITEADVARVARTLGIDVATQTQGYQIHYRGRFSVISVWMIQGLNLDKFCKDMSIRVTDNVTRLNCYYVAALLGAIWRVFWGQGRVRNLIWGLII